MEKPRLWHSVIRKIVSHCDLRASYDRVSHQAHNRNEVITFSEAIGEVYEGIYGRKIDRSEYALFINSLQAGIPLSALISDLISSEEFTRKHGIIPHRSEIRLPDLTKIYPDKYCRSGDDFSVFAASSKEDFVLLESLIAKHRYYDSTEVYSPTIDLDKVVTASIVSGLKAQSAIELGCFTGPVISLLADRGFEVCGVDISHLAIVLAYDNIRDKILFGDLLDLDFNRSYDAFIAMDVLEHLNPFRIDLYIEKIRQLVNANGFVLLNSPMFGNDDIFGTVFDIYFREWQEAGDDNFWRYIHCDAQGWPIHGHLTLASPKWWEKIFGQHGLVRDRTTEAEIQGILRGFFDKHAPSRRTLFVLRHENSVPDHATLRQSLRDTMLPVVAEMGLSAPYC
jgi:2-polyprenyl-3-methyl-5-hydroxy-6-metoxy-1,4-benzoquinol methylase